MSDPPRSSEPDPSLLTTAQLRHELASLRELVFTRIEGLDRAAVVLSENDNRVPTLLDREVAQIKELFGEKFDGIQKQFEERDVRSKASETSASTAVSAALQAQKEAAAAQNDANAAAITKSEASTVKQIDGIVALLAGGAKATDEKIAAINARLDRGEGTGSGKASNQSSMLAIGAIVVSVIVGGVSVITNLRQSPVAVISPSRP